MYNNLLEMIEKKAETSTDKIVIEYLNRFLQTQDTLNYGQLNQRAKATAALLQPHINRFDRVLLIFEPGIEFITALLGTIISGAIAVPVFPPDNKRLAEKLQSVIINSAPSLILSNQAMAHKIKKLHGAEWLSQLPIIEKISQPALSQHAPITVNFKPLQWLTTEHIDIHAKFTAPAIAPDDTAYLQYTSGSTSDPKGVMITHQNVLHNIDLILQQTKLDDSCNIFNWLPPYHDMGLICQIFHPLYSGCYSRFIATKDFIRAPLTWLKGISQFRANGTIAPNFAYQLVSKKSMNLQQLELDLSSLTFATCASEPIHLATIEQFCHSFAQYGFNRNAFYPAYGLAEATLFVSIAQRVNTLYCDPQHYQNNIISKTTPAKGYPLIAAGNPQQSVKIIHPETLQPLADGQVGEIWISSPSVAKGYWQLPELSQQMFGCQLADGQSYLRTGDLGFIDNELLYISGRRKDLIIINGQNHYPQDIEKTIEQSHRCLREHASAAFAITRQQTEQLVIVAEYRGENSRETQQQVIDCICTSLNKQHQLHPYRIVLIKPRTIFKTSSGKIQRQLTRRHYENNLLDCVFEWKQEDIEERVS